MGLAGGSAQLPVRGQAARQCCKAPTWEDTQALLFSWLPCCRDISYVVAMILISVLQHPCVVKGLGPGCGSIGRKNL